MLAQLLVGADQSGAKHLGRGSDEPIGWVAVHVVAVFTRPCCDFAADGFDAQFRQLMQQRQQQTEDAAR